MTRHKEIRTATSLLDYVSRYMLLTCDPTAYAALYNPPTPVVPMFEVSPVFPPKPTEH